MDKKDELLQILNTLLKQLNSIQIDEKREESINQSIASFAKLVKLGEVKLHQDLTCILSPTEA